MKQLNFIKNINLLKIKNLKNEKINNKSINLIDVEYNQKKAFQKLSKKSNLYIKASFDLAVKLIKEGFSDKLINGPISKNKFLNKNFLGITEYITNKFKLKNSAMLIYNKKLSVCPITTHLPINSVAKSIKKKLIINKIKLIDDFYKLKLGIKPKIAVTGLNPHCESIKNIMRTKNSCSAIKKLKGR